MIDDNCVNIKVMEIYISVNNIYTFLCKICGKSIHNRGVSKHITTHLNTPYKCELCCTVDKNVNNGIYIGYQEIIKHIHFHLEPQPKNKNNIIQNNRMHAMATRIHYNQNEEPMKPPVYSCYYCNETFSNPHKRLLHLTEHISTGATSIDDTEEYLKESSSPNPSLPSLRSPSPQTTVITIIPNAIITNYSESDISNNNNKSVNNNNRVKKRTPKVNVCHICGVKTTRLTKHLLTHTGDKNFKCNECQKTFTTKAAQNNHTIVHSTDGSSGIHSCKYCAKIFRFPQGLRRHIVVHHNDNAIGLPCPFCEKEFFRKESLQEHIRIHTGEKPFKCDVCNMYFSSRSVLRNHKLLHNQEKRYKCTKCDKYFTQYPGLYSHMKQHTRVK